MRQYWRRTHKFGIRITKKAKEALEIDEATGTNLWERALQKNMANVRSVFIKISQTVKK